MKGTYDILICLRCSVSDTAVDSPHDYPQLCTRSRIEREETWADEFTTAACDADTGIVLSAWWSQIHCSDACSPYEKQPLSTLT